jgi:hypothetical protein
VVLNAIFLKHAFAVWRRDEATAEADSFAAEKRLFRFSLSYLFLHFGALLADAALRLTASGGPETMPITQTHEMHTRRFGRNLGVALSLVGLRRHRLRPDHRQDPRRRLDGGL